MPKIEENSVNYNSLIGADFKNIVSSRQGPKHHIPILISLAITFIGVLIVSVVLAHSNQSTPALSNLSRTNFSNANLKDVSLALKPLADGNKIQAEEILNNPFPAPKQAIAIEEMEPVSVSAPLEDENRVTVVVKKGDTLSSIFKELDIHTELTRILNLGKDAKPFKKIYPGQKFHFTLDENGIDTLELEKSITKSLFLYRNDESFIVEESDRELDKISQVATGTINNSLFLAGQNAGMSDRLIMDLAGVFGWDIDFALDIREGDSFTVLYEELFLDGEKVGDGNIIAAEFINNGNYG